MTETVVVTTTDAITVLKCLREVIRSTLYLHHHLPSSLERTAMRTVIADQMAKYAHVLDLYLTDSSANRDIDAERAAALRLLMGTEWEVLLSDGESKLVIRLPTADDAESTKGVFPEHPKNAKAYHRWKNIDTPASQPTDFGPPDQNGQEIRI